MSETSGGAPVPARVATGIPGFDEILGGGLFAGGVYIVKGLPGAGKTILGNHFAFHHARTGGRTVYVTLLSETHGRLLSFLQTMSFFEASAVGNTLRYLNGYTAVESEGLPGLLKLVRQIVRESRATLLVIDGMITAANIANSEVEYKKFVNELQSWIEVVGCTVVLLTSARASELRPEYTMVDGIVELEYARIGSRRVRELTVVKFRGCAYLEGKHTYEITSDGIALFPRVEARFGLRPRVTAGEEQLAFGVPGMDRLLEGGLPRSSTTVLLGSSGTGKTALGLQFLAAGLEAGEAGVFFSFCEDPASAIALGDALGLELAEHARSGRLTSVWAPAHEPVLDRIGHDIVSATERTGARRLFVDGLEIACDAASMDRLPSFWRALSQEMRSRGVTVVASAEVCQTSLHDMVAPVPGISAIADTLIYLGLVERGAALARVLRVSKTRGKPHGGRLVQYELTHCGVRIGRSIGEDGAGAAVPRARKRRRGGGRRKP
jgi:circadian clock protein KaiC